MNLLLHTSSLPHFHCYLQYLFRYRWLPFMTDCIFTDRSMFYFHCIFQAVLGLYWLAQECRQLQKTACRLQKLALRTSQDFVQTSPPLDELLFALTNKPILIHQPEESPLITSLSSQKTPAPQQD